MRTTGIWAAKTFRGDSGATFSVVVSAIDRLPLTAEPGKFLSCDPFGVRVHHWRPA